LTAVITARLSRDAAPDWFPDWSGRTCLIVGSGPSARAIQDIRRAPKTRFRFKSIAVNTSFQLIKNPSMIYGCDWRWWKKFDGLPRYHGLKVSQDEDCQREAWGVKLVHADHRSDAIEMTRCGFIGWAGNSGFQAVNLAAQFGVSKIILVGFDMTLANGADHWHRPHGSGHPRPLAADVDRHRRATDAAAPALEALGIEVINTALKSALKNYPKMTLVDALAS